MTWHIDHTSDTQARLSFWARHPESDPWIKKQTKVGVKANLIEIHWDADAEVEE